MVKRHVLSCLEACRPLRSARPRKASSCFCSHCHSHDSLHHQLNACCVPLSALGYFGDPLTRRRGGPLEDRPRVNRGLWSYVGCQIRSCTLLARRLCQGLSRSSATNNTFESNRVSTKGSAPNLRVSPRPAGCASPWRRTRQGAFLSARYGVSNPSQQGGEVQIKRRIYVVGEWISVGCHDLADD
jgi:hypothetical protein